MEMCSFCGDLIKEKEKAKKRGKHIFHLKCFRKLRKKAKRQNYGDLDYAIRNLKKEDDDANI